MYQTFYREHALLLLPLATMLFFAGVFVVVTVRAWRRGTDDTNASLPLYDDGGTP